MLVELQQPYWIMRWRPHAKQKYGKRLMMMEPEYKQTSLNISVLMLAHCFPWPPCEQPLLDTSNKVSQSHEAERTDGGGRSGHEQFYASIDLTSLPAASVPYFSDASPQPHCPHLDWVPGRGALPKPHAAAAAIRAILAWVSSLTRVHFSQHCWWSCPLKEKNYTVGLTDITSIFPSSPLG